MKAHLRHGLSSLPTPKNDFEIVVPEHEDNEGVNESEADAGYLEDAADLEARRLAMQEAESKYIPDKCEASQQKVPCIGQSYFAMLGKIGCKI